MDEKILVTRPSMPSYDEYIEAIKPLWDSHWITNMGTYHQQLEKELKENNIEHILVSARGIKRVNTSEFRCDFYDLVDGDEKAAEKFFGEYMLEYSWAEERMALLSKYI